VANHLNKSFERRIVSECACNLIDGMNCSSSLTLLPHFVFIYGLQLLFIGNVRNTQKVATQRGSGNGNRNPLDRLRCHPAQMEIQLQIQMQLQIGMKMEMGMGTNTRAPRAPAFLFTIGARLFWLRQLLTIGH